MKRYHVGYEPEARADFDAIYAWLAEQAGLQVADRFAERLQTYCDRLDLAPHRGVSRHDLSPGLRVISFEKCVSIAFRVGDARVDVLRLAYRGRDLASLFNK